MKNHPVADTTSPHYPGYHDLKKRMPIAFGINLPAFRILDVLAIEAEWWDNDFANSYWGVYTGNKQEPYPWKYGSAVSGRIDPYGGPWHWSVFMQKTLLERVKLKAQAARDHTMLETGETGTSNGDSQEAMDGRGTWAWMGKIEFSF